MERKSVVIYKSFVDATRSIHKADFEKVWRTIFKYAFEGEIDENINGVTSIIFDLVKPQIDANNKRFVNGCKGGAKKGSRNNPNGRRGKKTNQELTKNKPKTNQELTKNKPNDNVNVNVNDNVLSNDNIKKESYDSKESENKINSSWTSFLDWLNKECPSVATMQQPLTITQYQTLLERYGKAELVQMLRTMENYKPLKQKNKSAYQTFLNWKKRDEDKNTRTINSHTKQCFNPDSTIGTNFRESDIEITDEDRNLLKNILATMPSIGR